MKLCVNSVYEEYVIGGKSDSYIANKFGVVRTAVSKYRKYHGIITRTGNGELGEKNVTEKLKQNGFYVEDMNVQIGKTHPFDLLVNNSIKVDVKTASKHIDGMWRFSLTNKQGIGIIESDRCMKLKNGRTKKLLLRTCEFLILCALSGSSKKYYVIPSSEVPKTLQTITVQDGGKWSIWENRWDLIN